MNKLVIMGNILGELIKFVLYNIILYIFYMCPTIYKQSVFNFPIVFIQATINELRSQITSLQAALAEATEEIAARTEHEAKLTSQFQVGPLLGVRPVFCNCCTVIICSYATIITIMLFQQYSNVCHI